MPTDVPDHAILQSSGTRAEASPLRSGETLYKRSVIGLIVVLISFCYLFVALRDKPSAAYGYSTELYALLATSFLQGKTSLPIQPKPELLLLRNPYDPVANYKYRLHEASLYKGRYYLYFGATPVVTLFVPCRLVTGRDLPNRVAVGIFCIGGYLCSCALFFLLARHNRWALPFWLQLAVVVSLGSMSLVTLLLKMPRVYQVAIAGGYCFVMAGFLLLAAAITSRRAIGWFALAGLMFGLAVGCRPHLVLVCGIVLLAFAIKARYTPRLVIALAAGMAVCGSVLAWYNYVRFDNPLEFGRSYQLTIFLEDPSSTHFGARLDLSKTLRAAEEFLFLTPHVDISAPYIHPVLINPLVAHPGQRAWVEDTVGGIVAAPLALLGLMMPLFVNKWLIANPVLDENSSWLLYVMFWSVLVIFLTLCVVGWILGRYLVDFVPLLTLEGVCVMVMLWQIMPRRPIKYLYSVGICAVTIYGALVSAALAIPFRS